MQFFEDLKSKIKDAFNDPTVAVLFLILFFSVLAAAHVVFIVIIYRALHHQSVEWLFKLGLPIMWLGYYLHYQYRRYDARANKDTAVGELLAADSRPPVLYLRSFADENVGQYANWMKEKTQEEVMVSAFNQFGPVIAIGQPYEDFPMLGATRFQSGNWREDVTELLQTARLVIVRTADSDGLLWEIEQALELLSPERLVLIVPAGKEKYNAFREKVGSYFALPEYPPKWKTSRNGIKGIIYFQPGWQAKFLTFKRSFLRESTSNVLSESLQNTLKPVCEQLDVRWSPPSINWVRLIVLPLIAVAAFYVIYNLP